MFNRRFVRVPRQNGELVLFSQDRDQMRSLFCQAWQKHCNGQALEPLEQMIVAVVEKHPEYHSLLAHPDAALQEDFSPERGETNPFLHMGLHIALREQLAVDRPEGIAAVYRKLGRHLHDGHEVEHRMLACLADTLWEAQHNGAMPDEQVYLQRLRRLVKKNE